MEFSSWIFISDTSGVVFDTRSKMVMSQGGTAERMKEKVRHSHTLHMIGTKSLQGFLVKVKFEPKQVTKFEEYYGILLKLDISTVLVDSDMQFLYLRTLLSCFPVSLFGDTKHERASCQSMRNNYIAKGKTPELLLGCS